MNRSKTNDLASLWTGLRQIIWHINDDRCQADASRRKNNEDRLFRPVISGEKNTYLDNK